MYISQILEYNALVSNTLKSMCIPKGDPSDGRERPGGPGDPERGGGGPQPRRDMGIPLLKGRGPVGQEIHKVG